MAICPQPRLTGKQIKSLFPSLVTYLTFLDDDKPHVFANLSTHVGDGTAGVVKLPSSRVLFLWDSDMGDAGMIWWKMSGVELMSSERGPEAFGKAINRDSGVLAVICNRIFALS